MNDEDLNGAASRAALFVIGGLPGYCAAEGLLSANGLKALGEHLGILRAIAARHPHTRAGLAEQVRPLRPVTTSVMFAYFCLRNPGLFRLWGSILADLAFFFPDRASAHRRFIESTDPDAEIAAESSEFRRLDAADICRRSGVHTPSATAILAPGLAGTVLATRSYSAERFGTRFIYQLTHTVFYSTDWGQSAQSIPVPVARNLAHAAAWSMAAADADLVAECVVALSYCGLPVEAALIEFLQHRQAAGGAVIREPGGETRDGGYATDRHTTLVALWAMSEAARGRSRPLHLDLPEPARPQDFSLTAADHDRTARRDLRALDDLEALNACYARVELGQIGPAERQQAANALAGPAGFLPFRCPEHHLAEVARSARHPAAERHELLLPQVLTHTLLGIVAGQQCERCTDRFRTALAAVLTLAAPADLTGCSVDGNGEFSSLAGILDTYLSLPLIRAESLAARR